MKPNTLAEAIAALRVALEKLSDGYYTEPTQSTMDDAWVACSNALDTLLVRQYRQEDFQTTEVFDFA